MKLSFPDGQLMYVELQCGISLVGKNAAEDTATTKVTSRQQVMDNVLTQLCH